MLHQLNTKHQHGPDYVCSRCGQPLSCCTCAGNHEIANKIGFLFDAEDGQWYNRSCQPCTDEDAGFCAYHTPGVNYGDLTSAAMREGWLQASGFEDYCATMMRQGDKPARVVVSTAVAAGQAYRVAVHA